MTAQLGNRCLIDGDTHVVDSGTSGSRDFPRGRDQEIAELAGQDKGDIALRGDRALVMGVAGKRERRIRQREDKTAVGDAVSVHHVRQNLHGQNSLAGFDLEDLHAETFAGVVFLPHGLRACACQIIGRERGFEVHCALPARMVRRDPVRSGCKMLLPSHVQSHGAGTSLFLAEVCFSARRRLRYAGGVIATMEIAPYFQRSRTIQAVHTAQPQKAQGKVAMQDAGNIVLVSGLLIGLAYGAIGLLSGFCLLSSLRGWWTEGDSRLIRTYALALGVAVAATQLLAAGSLVDIGKSIYLQPTFSAPLMFIGGLLFGYGMVLSNGCGSRALVLLGRGNLRSFVVIIVLGIAAQMTLKGLIAPGRIALLHASQATPKVVTLPALLSTLGIGETFARTLAASVIAGALIIFAFAHAPFQRARAQIAAGIGVGLLVAAGWFNGLWLLDWPGLDGRVDVGAGIVRRCRRNPAGHGSGITRCAQSAVAGRGAGCAVRPADVKSPDASRRGSRGALPYA